MWADLQHDAEQQISYAGIHQCWEQGCELLDEPYRPQLVSVHDPDEYLARRRASDERRRRFDDVLDAYRALGELEQRGRCGRLASVQKIGALSRRSKPRFRSTG